MGVFEAALAVFKGVDVLKSALIESDDFAKRTVCLYEGRNLFMRTGIPVNSFTMAMWLTNNLTDE